MKQTASIISTYAADVSGVCSALYELGGMTVIHDPSGCNSTYNTHDEPRWYDQDSMVFISGLSEMEAIMGDDEKLIGDMVTAAQQLHPRFIALTGSPVPMIIGTDFSAIASVVQHRTGIPCFGFFTNGMHSYLSGAGMAFEAVAKHLVEPAAPGAPKEGVNLLGVTPLDFTVNGSVQSMRRWLGENGFAVKSCWAMGSSLEELTQAGSAAVNLVVSQSGWKAAQALRETFGTPFVVGTPIGSHAAVLAGLLRKAAQTGECFTSVSREMTGPAAIAVIGEGVYSASLAGALQQRLGKPVRVLCPLEVQPEFLAPQDAVAPDEDDLTLALADAAVVVADPLYRPICPSDSTFVPLPHEAFSGRIYRSEIPDLTDKQFDRWASNWFKEEKK